MLFASSKVGQFLLLLRISEDLVGNLIPRWPWWCLLLVGECSLSLNKAGMIHAIKIEGIGEAT